MKRPFVVIAFLCATVSAVVVAQNRSAAQPRIEGVWRVVEQRINDRVLSTPELGAGFIIFTSGHFAVVRESDKAPRPDPGNVDTATADQLRAAWGPFVAQIGTYEISGDLLVEKILVAKNPSNVTGAGVSRRRFRVEGNTLITEPYDRTPGRTITLRMVRVE